MATDSPSTNSPVDSEGLVAIGVLFLVFMLFGFGTTVVVIDAHSRDVAVLATQCGAKLPVPEEPKEKQ